MNAKVAKGPLVLSSFEAVENPFICFSSTSCVMYSTGNGGFVAWRSVELTTKLSLFLLVEILRCSAFTAAVKVEMGLFSFLVMVTPRKENKRCHLTTNLYQSPLPCIRGVLSCKEVLWLPLLGNVTKKVLLVLSWRPCYSSVHFLRNVWSFIGISRGLGDGDSQKYSLLFGRYEYFLNYTFLLKMVEKNWLYTIELRGPLV